MKMLRKINLIVFILITSYNCSTEQKKVFRLHTLSHISATPIKKIINNKTYYNYEINKGNNFILEYVKYYDDKNSIDEEYGARMLIEFSQNNFDKKEYSYNDKNIKLFLQTSNLDGFVDYQNISGIFSVIKFNKKYQLKVIEDIIGELNGKKFLFLNKGSYHLKTSSND